MIVDRIKITKELGYSQLYLDFISGQERLRPFFNSESIEEKLKKLSSREFPRKAVAEILKQQNRNWKAPPEVFDTIEKIKRENGVVIATGQQACLFGGPYLIILKALAAVKRAKQLERDLKVPVLPLFWIAADDHDFEEISTADILDPAGKIARLSIDSQPNRIYPPVGRLAYDESIEREINRLNELLPDNDFKTETINQILSVYKPGRAIVDCFAEYLLKLIGRFGIVPFNPHDEKFKALAVPIMVDLIGRYREVKQGLSKTEKQLAEAGYHIQVKKRPSAAHLFSHEPERTPIHFDEESDNFRFGNHKVPTNELIDQIIARPNDFSPDVLSRPPVQSYIFPVIQVIGGPAEAAYFAQLMPLFDLFGLVRPTVLCRPSITLVEKRFEKLIEQYQLSYPEIAVDMDGTVKTLMRNSFPTELEARFEAFSDSINEGLKGLREQLQAYDSNLSEIAGRAGEKIDYQIKQLQQKVFASHKKKNRIVRDKLIRLYNNLFPNRDAAERSIAAVYFISRYGEGIFDYIYENMDIDETGHQLLTLSRYNG